jgi:hypothetical protein
MLLLFLSMLSAAVSVGVLLFLAYFLPSNYEYDYPRALVKRISKFYDDMVAGKFKDTLVI